MGGYEETLHLLHSFYDFSFVTKQPTRNITRLIHKAHEKREDQKIWEMWLARYQHMTKKDFISYEEFKRKLKAPAVVLRQSNETVQDTYNRFKNMIKRSAS